VPWREGGTVQLADWQQAHQAESRGGRSGQVRMK
jgi:hypothetical protein